jgi:hypothetical protein
VSSTGRWWQSLRGWGVGQSADAQLTRERALIRGSHHIHERQEKIHVPATTVNPDCEARQGTAS